MKSKPAADGSCSREYITRLEDALCCAICIIRNESGVKCVNGDTEGESTLMRWTNELIEESGIDFDAVLSRPKPATTDYETIEFGGQTLPKYCECGGKIEYDIDFGMVFSVCSNCSPVQTVNVPWR